MNSHQLAEYLTWLHDQKVQHRTVFPEKYHYKTLEQVVLECGFVFDIINRAHPVKRGRMKACYLNSFNAVVSDPRLIYCEGYATSQGALKGMLPVLHAWAITVEGEVIDPTWQDGETYIGIPFDWKFVMASVEAYEQISLLDNPGNAWPVMQLYPTRFVDTRWVDKLLDRGDLLGYERARV